MNVNIDMVLSPWVLIAILVGPLLVSAVLSRRRETVLRVPARFENVRSLMALVSQFARKAHLSDQAIYDCRLALDEACANIIRHSYANDPEGEIEVVIEAGRKQCRIALTDFGEPYDPAGIPTPQMGRPIDDMKPGGLGLYLMRTVMDEVSYRPGRDGNCLVMVKRE